ncbi:hypothetical protein [Novosphingobium cyanobacteriorum]|uniref:Uncharacterized protein n=1 Tax=Novosphingobium cyanobacteriorum TaxID=3024215 RepID=A0ABT6CDA7_9SPHN|nr:hypothetical protein [Novosphingobium cyanobacteriorum]MDF8331911.1 hypothetical protein [Novosphingobium cyanobacteriorum]
MAVASHHFLGIDPKLYRHFAAATLVISLGVAIIADSDNPEGVVAKAEDIKVQADRQRAADAAKPKPKLVDKRQASPRGEAGYYTIGGYGSPMDNVGDSGSGIIVPQPLPMQAMIAPDQALMARMSPAQRAAYLRQLDDQRRKLERQGPYRPSSAEISALTNASAIRSGSDNAD